MYLVTAIVLVLVRLASAQYVTLTAGPGKGASQTISVASNELATVVHLSTGYWVEGGQLEVVSGGITNSYCVVKMVGGRVPSSSGFENFDHANLPVIAGPATFRVWVPEGGSNASYFAVCTLQVTKPNSVFTPINTVVIPDDTNGPVTIILESSTDMVNWVVANPGTYGTTSSNRFFRVRAQR